MVTTQSPTSKKEGRSEGTPEPRAPIRTPPTYLPLQRRLYENADARKRDLEQLEQISSAYSIKPSLTKTR